MVGRDRLGTAALFARPPRPEQFALLASACLALFLLAGSAHAQSYSGYITLEPIPAKVRTGETVTFSGQLITGQDSPVPGATVYIKDDVAFGSDTLVKTLVTGDDGRFSGTWTAQLRGSGAWDFYAAFDGSRQVGEARSPTQSVRVSSSYSADPAGGSDSKYRTSITLDAVPASAHAGDLVAFTGRLTAHGQPLAGATVNVYEDDPLQFDQLLGSGATGSEGTFSVTWRADTGLIETDFDVYASYAGDAVYEQSRTPNQTVGVHKIGGSITLDPLPSSANVGEAVTFSGTLKLDGYSQGAAVYIKDEDPFDADDLLATAYVKSDGSFSADWFADYVDLDGEADVYAVFEGNGYFHRLTTCDGGPTSSLGGACPYTRPLAVRDSVPAIQPYVYSGDEYMELLYSLDFYRSPHVAIVPSPDSYDEVKGHIMPVREGISMWTNQMEGTYGGDWGVTFEVVERGDLFDSEPDVIVNIATYDSHAPCYADYYGVSYPSQERPVQAIVCSTSEGERRPDADVSATAAHEFIHAVGLGHAFNKTGDMMCSAENGVPTCDRLESRAKTPSAFSLAAVARMYGADGFKNPNNAVAYEEIYPPRGGAPAPEPAQCEYDYPDVGVDLGPEEYDWYPVCGGPVHYYFAAGHEYDEFEIYVLPLGTDVVEFIDGDAASETVCDDVAVQHVHDNVCYAESGANIVLYNGTGGAVRVDGHILGHE